MFLRRSFNLCLHKLVICQHKKENPEENLLKCSHCSYTASASAVLKRHVTMNHKTFESVIKVLCEDCGLKFTSNANMEEHRVTKHKPITPVKDIERYETPNDSLVLSLSKEERSENCSTSFSFHIDHHPQLLNPCPVLQPPLKHSLRNVHSLDAPTLLHNSSPQLKFTMQGTRTSSSAISAQDSSH